MQKRRYPLIPVTNIVLKVIAVAALVFFGYIAISGYASAINSWFHGSQQASMYGMMPVPAVKGFTQRLLTLLQPTLMLLVAFGLSSLAWGLSDVMTAAREIEFRTRKALGGPDAAKAADTKSEEQPVSA